MALFKCKMCGGALEVGENDKIYTCDYCGTQQTLPKLNDDRRANLYDRANHFRRSNEFDKAMAIYEQILNDDKDDSEAYWSLVLCQYGIEYVEDPVTKARIPTVNRAQFTSVLADENYKSALEHADPQQKTVYEAEAHAIDEIQKGILAISSKEEPFDVFICYKESDANGERTRDSVLAQDLYYGLKDEGFKVFFARITLEDKLGSAYEPYIFAALNSSKVMVVLGTTSEHFNAVWVKNEWSRFLNMMKQGQKKVLIPAYCDMDPYNLPEEFSHLQSQDMSKLGFMQDLIRGIKKISGKDKKDAAKEAAIAFQKSNEREIAPLMKRAFLFLEDSDWNSALEYSEKILDVDPECSKAYIVKVLIDYRKNSTAQLASLTSPIDKNPNYIKALRFAKGDEKKEILGYNKAILDRLDLEHKTRQYNASLALMKANKLDEAIVAFSKIKGFRDADQKIKDCNYVKELNRKRVIYEAALRAVAPSTVGDIIIKKSIASLETVKDYRDAADHIEKLKKRLDKWYADKKEAEEKAAREAELARLKAIENKKKAIKIIKISAIGFVAIALIVVLLVFLIIPTARMSKADKAYNNGDLNAAYDIYQDLNGFGKSEKRIATIDAIRYMQNNELENAVNTLLAAGIPVEVTYDANGGEISASSVKNVGGIIMLNAAENSDEKKDTFFMPEDFNGFALPAKRGYTFLAWKFVDYSYDIKSKDDQPFEFSVLADWDTTKYSITYDLDGATGVQDNPEKYTVESSDITLLNPSKAGHTFIGWTGEDIITPSLNVVIAKGSVGNKTFKANWEVNEYNISFDAAGGTVSIADMGIDYGAQCTLPTPERSGYTFLGWYCGNVEYTSGIWTHSGDVELVAYWRANTYNVTLSDTEEVKANVTVTFNPNCDSLEATTVTLANGEVLEYPTTPERDGYIFIGWYVDETLIEKYTFSGYITDNMTLYAGWIEESYAVEVYNSEYYPWQIIGGVLTSTNKTNPSSSEYRITAQYAMTVTFKYMTSSESGYDILYIRKNGSNLTSTSGTNADYTEYSVYLNAGEYLSFVYSKDGSSYAGEDCAYIKDIEFTADDWYFSSATAICGTTAGYKYSVGQEYAMQITYYSNYTLPELVREGYTFLGWFNEETKIESETWNIASDVTLTPMWEANSYTVTLNANGGTASSASLSVTYDEDYTLPTPTRDGYVFNGWFNGTNKVESGTWTGIEDITLTASWTAKNFTVIYKDVDNVKSDVTVTFNYNGNGLSDTTETLEDGDTLTYPTDPTREGYIFTGWYTDSDCTQRLSANIEEDTTLYAGWQALYTSNVYTSYIINPTNYYSGNAYSIYTSSTYSYSQMYIYLVANESGEHTIYYKNGYSYYYYATYIGITNMTTGTSIKDTESCSSTYYNSVTFTCNAGDVIAINCYRYSNSEYAYFYFEGFSNNKSTVADVNTVGINVTYDPNYDGAESTEVYVNSGKTVSCPEAPVREGYIFTGWYTDAECTERYDFTGKVIANLNLYAGWQKHNDTDGYTNTQIDASKYSSSNVYTLSTGSTGMYQHYLYFVANESGEHSISYAVSNAHTISVKNMTTDTAIVEPSECNSSEYTTLTFTCNAGDIILVDAKAEHWLSNVYLYFDGFTATTSSANVYIPIEEGVIYKVGSNIEFDVAYGEAVTLIEPSRVGYTFLGWYNGDDKVETGNWSISADTTLIAKWQLDVYNITLDANGGEASSDSLELKYGDKYELPTPTRTGYTFGGWFDGETLVESGLWTGLDDATLVAKWTANTYTVTFSDAKPVMGDITITYDPNYNESEVTTVDVKNGETVSYPADPTRSGYVFTGWYTDKSCTERFTFTETLTEDITLYAGWQIKYFIGSYACPNTIIVPSLYNQAGSSYSVDTTSTGTGASTSSAGSEYYIYLVANESGNHTIYFKNGSYNYNSGTYIGVTNITTDTTIRDTAIYTSTYYDYVNFTCEAGDVIAINVYKYIDATNVYFYFAGFNAITSTAKAESSTVASLEYTPGENYECEIDYDEILNVAHGTRAGHTFLGWYNGETIVKTGTWTETEDITLTAKWEVDEYTVTFDPNGGTVSSTTATVTYEEVITLPTPTRTGYTFEGWFDGDTKVESGEWKGTADVTLVAKWTANSYKITYEDIEVIKPVVSVTYNYNDGETDDYTVTFADGDEISYPADPSRNGYVFRGWYTDEECTERFSFSGTVTEDITLYAGWQVYYSVNVFSSSVISPTNYQNSSTAYSTYTGSTYSDSQRYIYLVANESGEHTIYYKNGYSSYYYATYIGITNMTTGTSIKDTESCSSTYYDSATFTCNAGDVIVINCYRYSNSEYAYFYFEGFTVASGTATVEPSAVVSYNYSEGSTYEYDITYDDALTLPTPTREGYTFAGWYDGETKFEATEWTSTSDVTLTPKWEVCEYEITFDADGGEVSETSVTVAYEEEITLPEPTKTGYTFDGWFDGDTKVESGKWTKTDDVTLVAKWIANKYTITYDDITSVKSNVTVTYNYNGNGSDDTTKTLENGDDLSYPSAPTRSGYVFTGWYLDKDCTDRYDFSGVISYDMTLYAGWQQLNTENVYSGYTIASERYNSSSNYYYISTSGTSSNNQYYLYLVANESGEHKIYYKNSSNSTDSSACIGISNLTSGETIMETTSVSNTYYSSATFTCDAGDVIVINVYAYYYSSYAYLYFEGFTSASSSAFARFETGEIDITYNYNYEGATSSVVTLSEDGETLNYPSDPSRNGYVFTGWYTDADCTTRYTFDSTLYDDITLYAGWVEMYSNTYSNYIVTPYNYEYDVTYYSVSTSGTSSSYRKYIYVVANESGEHTIYVANYSSSDSYAANVGVDNMTADVTIQASTSCTSTEYTAVTFTCNAGDVIAIDVYGTYYSTTVYFYFSGFAAPSSTADADCSMESFTVTYKPNYSSGYETVVSINNGEALAYPTDLSRTGYVFTGWYTDEECNTKYDFSGVIDEDLVLYAGWQAYVSDSAYSNNEVSGAYYNSEYYAYSIGTSGSDSSYQKYMYIVANESGEHTIYFKNSSSGSNYASYVGITNITTDETIKDTALVESTSYDSVTFTCNAGDVICINTYAYYYSATMYFYFEGFEYNSSSAQAIEGYVYSSGKSTEAKVTYGEDFELPTPTRVGYTFLGWYNGDDKIEDGAWDIASDVTLTAKWEEE